MSVLNVGHDQEVQPQVRGTPDLGLERDRSDSLRGKAQKRLQRQNDVA